MMDPKTTEGDPETEVGLSAKRRRFTKEYKLSILEKADACKGNGDLGRLLRQEGLYSSHLTSWRKQRREGSLRALGRRRGPKPKRTPEQAAMDALRRENDRLRKKLEHAEKVIGLPKKLSEVMGIQLEDHGDGPDGS